MSVRKTVSIKKGQTLNYTIMMGGVVTASGSEVIDTWEDVVINEERYTFTLNVEPADASYSLTSDDGATAEGNTIRPSVGSIVSYTVSKPGYATVSDTYEMGTADHSETVKLAVSPDEYDFVFNITGSSYKLPFTVGDTTGNYDLDIHWGDNTTTLIPASTTLTNTMLTHSYSTSGNYQIEIRSTTDNMPTTCFYGDTKLTSIASPMMTTPQTGNATSGHGIFTGCSNLTSVVADTFRYNTQITDFSNVFEGCSSLSSVSGDIFKYNTNATAFYSAFKGTNLSTIPNDLFKYNTKGNAFAWCFQNCANLTSMPTDLFAYCTVGSSTFDMQECFSGCPKLQLTSDIFGSSSVKTTRFAGYSNVNFYKTFYIDSFTGTTRGTAPDLWDWTFTSKISGDCFGGNGNTTLSNYSSILLAWGGAGVTLTINPTPVDATVVLTASGYTQVGNTITVDAGTNVQYTVSKNGYETETGILTVSLSYTENIILTELVTFTIQPTPNDANVVLTASGYTQSGNSIVVSSGTTVSWSVSKTGYVSQSGSEVVSTNTTNPVVLVPSYVTYTINPTPVDATVVLTASGYTQSGNSIDVDPNTSVDWTVSKTGYETQSGTKLVTTTETDNVILVQGVSLTINTTPNDADVEFEILS